MLNITFLVGPPASGKTYRAKQIMSMFPEYRTISISALDKKRLQKVLKNQLLYDVLHIDEANKKDLRKLEYFVINYSKNYRDLFTQMSTGVEKPIFNILICSQDPAVYSHLILFKQFNSNVIMNVIECNYKFPF